MLGAILLSSLSTSAQIIDYGSGTPKLDGEVLSACDSCSGCVGHTDENGEQVCDQGVCTSCRSALEEASHMFGALADRCWVMEYQFTSSTSDCAAGQPVDSAHLYSRNSFDAGASEGVLLIYNDTSDTGLGNGEPGTLRFQGDAYFDGTCTAAIQWCEVLPGTGTGTNTLFCDTVYWIGFCIENDNRPRLTAGCSSPEIDSRLRWYTEASGFESPDDPWVTASDTEQDAWCDVGLVIDFD